MGKSEEIVNVYNDRWKTTLKIVENLKGKWNGGGGNQTTCVRQRINLYGSSLIQGHLKLRKTSETSNIS